MTKQLNQFFTQSMLAIALAGASMHVAAAATIEVYKSPTCGCCSKWVDHLRDHGFTVNTHDVGNQEARARAGISPSLGSCHTATVNGYAIEGHVPAADIQRLLREKPRAVGLAVPDMPHGSPGMETGRNDPYNVLLIRKPGDERSAATIYSRYGTDGQTQTGGAANSDASGSVLRLR
ncbi:DUF411 domain-containing protein [Nitrosomonas sp. ANs5]|uniref:DUF411 domain-containing protein n=1 Tax=Nitrosomonas sp. ANs5 TaxID=3423941 RepID=UPI003D341194